MFVFSYVPHEWRLFAGAPGKAVEHEISVVKFCVAIQEYLNGVIFIEYKREFFILRNLGDHLKNFFFDRIEQFLGEGSQLAVAP